MGQLGTAARWADLWLNEGVATFLASAYRESRWGRDEYDRELALARRRYASKRAQGLDRPLALPGDPAASEVGGSIPYAKGILVLHLLRYELGDAAFWRGLREYTSRNLGCAVSSLQLQAAMERASGRPLQVFFAQWVNGSGVPEVVARHAVRDGTLELTFEQRQASPWQVPIELAIETDRGRETQRVWLRERRRELQVKLAGELRSVRVDARAQLPFAIEHERSIAMLQHQAVHEPDALGRAEAIERLAQTCQRDGAPSECAGLSEWLAARSAADRARLVRSVVEAQRADLACTPAGCIAGASP